ncbi:Unknown protein [Striga hermonthica]|uniref:Coiled-coil domain-containing protein n=1 Tax=Striga hermonthica TaxID=68872 RepID=A0A9N7MX24_STRHE|nr:Unknown protein [Striga hermonthica]
MANKTGVNGKVTDGAEPKSRAQKRREEKEDSRAESAAKKAEARRLAEVEAAAEAYGRRKKKAVTRAEMELRKEEEVAELRRRVEEKRRKEASRSADEREYRSMVCGPNTNRAGLDVDARTVEEAIGQLTMEEDGRGRLPMDRHPERRIKALFKVFEDTHIKRLKEEKPGLTLSQYKDAILKLWKKSSDNPINATYIKIA